MAVAQTALAAGPTPCVGGERTQVIVHVDADVLAGLAELGRCHVVGGAALATETASSSESLGYTGQSSWPTGTPTERP